MVDKNWVSKITVVTDFLKIVLYVDSIKVLLEVHAGNFKENLYIGSPIIQVDYSFLIQKVRIQSISVGNEKEVVNFFFRKTFIVEEIYLYEVSTKNEEGDYLILSCS